MLFELPAEFVGLGLFLQLGLAPRVGGLGAGLLGRRQLLEMRIGEVGVEARLVALQERLPRLLGADLGCELVLLARLGFRVVAGTTGSGGTSDMVSPPSEP